MMQYFHSFFLLSVALLASLQLVTAQQIGSSDYDTPPSLILEQSENKDNVHTIKQTTTLNTNLQQHERLLQNAGCYADNFFLGVGYDDNFNKTGSTFTPVSPNVAAGMNRLVAVVRSIIEVRTKNGTVIFRDSLADFFNSTSIGASNSSLYEPRVLYDEYEGRFVVVTILTDFTRKLSCMLLAVSKNEDPDSTGKWNFATFDSSETINNVYSFANFPSYGIDNKAIYITANMFAFQEPRPLTGVRLWIIDKGLASGFYGSGASPTQVRGPFNPYQDGGQVLTTVPAHFHGAGTISSSISNVLVSATYSPFAELLLQVIAINNPLGVVTFTYNLVNTGQAIQFSGVELVPQLGTTALIYTYSARVNNAVWQNNKLWVTYTINTRGELNDNQATAHWVWIDTSNGLFALNDKGSLGGESFSSGAHTYNPAIEVNKQGNVVVSYVASSQSMYVGAYGSLVIGTNELPFVVKRGLDYFIRRDYSGRNSIGFYSGVAVDPFDDSFWVYNQYADKRSSTISGGDEDGRWGTAWARVYCNATVCTYLFFLLLAMFGC
jgi:hypothetical protein